MARVCLGSDNRRLGRRRNRANLVSKMINIPFSTRRSSRLVATFWTAYFLAIAPALAIFNGTVDDTDVFASTVQLQNDSGGSCSGVIVYPHVVMTAAHCFILGGLNGWRVIGVRSGTSTVRNVSQIIVNPGYKNSIKGTLYDGAAVILDKPFDIPPGRHLGEFIDLRAVYENWGEGVRLTKVDDHRIKVLGNL